jgi:hypothetical protein
MPVNINKFHDIFTYDYISCATTCDTSFRHCTYNSKSYYEITVQTGSLENDALFYMDLHEYKDDHLKKMKRIFLRVMEA